jgi:hypothetical protein
MENCYLCNIKLSKETWSKEHILLNSIGGRLKSKNLLCSTCNSKFGQEADSELSSQLLFLSSFLNIKRENGENPIIKGAKTKDGKEYDILNGGAPSLAKPTFESFVDNDKIQYSISARNEKELINMLKGLSRKHPEFDLEEAKKEFKWHEEYLNEPLNHEMQIGGELAFKSITKTAVNYYIYVQSDINEVSHLFKYLRGEEELKICKHFYPIKSIYRKDSNEIVHLIHLFGSKQKRLLYCFVEFFSSYSFIILLSDNYCGKNVNSTYCYDILKNQEVIKNVNLKLKREEIESIYKLTKNDIEVIVQKLNRILRIGEKIQTEKIINNIASKTIKKVYEKHKHELFFTKEMMNDICQELANEYVKYAHRGGRHRDDKIKGN